MTKSIRTPPIILQRKLIAQTRIFKIEQMDLRFANGTEVQYERIVSSSYGAVLIVPLLNDHTVLLIREYAGGVARYEIALPKGRVETGEDILQAANREIKEEIGYGAHKLEHLKSLTIAPGYLNHATHIIVASDLYPEKQQGDEPEDIDVIPWDLNKLDDLLAHEECTEARSIAALFMVKEKLKHV